MDSGARYDASGWTTTVIGIAVTILIAVALPPALAQSDTNDDGGSVEPECEVELDPTISTGITSLESRDPDGDPVGGVLPAISGQGDYLAFASNAPQLTGNTSGQFEFFVRDRGDGSVQRASVDSGGEPADLGSSFALSALSSDGRLVAFSSNATNLVPGDTNGQQDVFVRNLVEGTTRRISVSTTGEQGTRPSFVRDISSGGRWVVFTSSSSEFVDGDTNGVSDVFLHNQESGVTRRVSVDSFNQEAMGDTPAWQAAGSSEGSTSGGGRYTAFSSHASNLVPGDTNQVGDIFVHDRSTGATTRVSVSSAGVQGDSHSGRPAISADGRFVTFASSSSNLVPGASGRQVYVHDRETAETSLISAASNGDASLETAPTRLSISARGRYIAFDSASPDLAPDNNSTFDVFVRDTELGLTERVSESTSGVEGNGPAFAPAVSRDGRWVSFYSGANNHVAGDLNGVNDVFVHDRFSTTESETEPYPCVGPPDDDPDIGPPTYVAMGDSYQSGVGTNQYLPETDIADVNECKRSPASHPPLLFRNDPEDLIPGELRFVACSGSTVQELYDGKWGEPSQFDALGLETTLVTIGIGGNDLGFASVIKDCVKVGYILRWISCADRYDDQILDGLNFLLGRTPDGHLNPLQIAYYNTARRAPRAQILALSYPRWFDESFPDVLFPARCAGIRYSDQLWMNYKISQLSHAIEASSLSMGVRFVDIYEASDEHEICNPHGNPRYVNGVVFPVSQGISDSFHPTVFGYERTADELRRAIRGEIGPLSSAQSFSILPGETIASTHTVVGGPGIGFSTAWPGSDVVMTLRSPTGRVIDRATEAADVFHAVGPIRENYFITDPEPGEWTIELFGADVDPEGELTTLQVFELPVPNEEPIAGFDIVHEGTTVTVDAGASTDPDGDIVEYIWDFDDGTVATGPTATHTFEEPGTYAVTLAVRDDRGGMDFESVKEDDVVFVPRYDFKGFKRPVENQPSVNKRQAGQAVPVRFEIPGGYGLGIIEDGYPQVQQIDCSTGEVNGSPVATESPGGSGFRYDETTDRYVYVWKTDLAWASTCQRFTLGLDDGGRYAADFMF